MKVRGHVLRWTRILPALLVGTLLLLAVSAPARHASIPVADANSAVAGPCVLYQGGGSGSAVVRGNGQGVVQPIGFTGNIESCSLSVHQLNIGASGTVEVVEWDPIALAPDPAALAYSGGYFSESELLQGRSLAIFSPPVIVTPSPYVAEVPRQTLAINYRTNYWPQNIEFEESGDLSTPAAMQFDAAGVFSPLPGTHPLLAHAICSGDQSIMDRRVVQCVMTSDVDATDPSIVEVLQSFTVPVPTAVHWAEVGGRGAWVFNGQPDVAIIDPEWPAPITTIPASAILAHSILPVVGDFGSAPRWVAAFDFDQRPVLEPGHTYWLRVRTFNGYLLRGRHRTLPESPAFTSGIGGFFKRSRSSDPWQPVSDVSLNFRLIGEQLGPAVGVPASSPSTALRLRIAPNPTRGVALARWSGAQGPVQIVMIDANGRRVAGARVSGTAGQWSLPATGDNGRLLAAGVYFVRAIDARGTAVTERVVFQP